jgi:hypothetical protein
MLRFTQKQPTPTVRDKLKALELEIAAEDTSDSQFIQDQIALDHAKTQIETVKNEYKSLLTSQKEIYKSYLTFDRLLEEWKRLAKYPNDPKLTSAQIADLGRNASTQLTAIELKHGPGKEGESKAKAAIKAKCDENASKVNSELADTFLEIAKLQEKIRELEERIQARSRVSHKPNGFIQR